MKRNTKDPEELNRKLQALDDVFKGDHSIYGGRNQKIGSGRAWDAFETLYKIDPEAAIVGGHWGRYQVEGINLLRLNKGK